MRTTNDRMNLLALCLCFCIATLCSFTHCGEARRMSMPLLLRGPGHDDYPRPRRSIINSAKKIFKHLDLDIDRSLDSSSSNTGPYGVSSPFSLPPYDSLAPIPLPEINAPPFCVYPPSTPQPPSTTIPMFPPPPPSSSSTPTLPFQSPPPSPSATVPGPPESLPSPPNPPQIVPGPPTSVPTPRIPALSPPSFEPSPPNYRPGPPQFAPSPPSIFVPSPPVFQPPVVYPPPAVPPPPFRGPSMALWCVAKPTVPDPIIQEAMNYACASGADCDSILPNGACFQPNTLFAHASYAFNSYWQRTKVAGGTCEFGGTAMLVTVDPSYDGCHFMYF